MNAPVKKPVALLTIVSVLLAFSAVAVAPNAVLNVGPVQLPGTSILNSLTPAEKAAGWQFLFDGQSLKGWRLYGKPGSSAAQIGSGWQAEEGVLKKLAGKTGGDIITEKTFDDYEFSWDWRLAKGANNGVKYFVTESRPQAPGFEYQMIDEGAEPYQKLRDKDKTASFYDVLAPAADKPLKPAGEWNSSRIIVRGNHVEHWLNGKQVLAYELGSELVRAAVADSKFKKFPDFATKIRGHIMLTDHDDEAWFRNIKLRELAAK